MFNLKYPGALPTICVTGKGTGFAAKCRVSSLINRTAECRNAITDYLPQKGADKLLEIKPAQLLKIVFGCSHFVRKSEKLNSNVYGVRWSVLCTPVHGRELMG
jgi:hypothetical protein